MKELIQQYVLSDYGIRLIVSFAGFTTGYYSVMSLFGQIIQLEKKEKAKKMTKILASVIAVIVSLLSSFLISVTFYYIEEKRVFITQTISWWIFGGAIFMGLKNINKVSKILKIIRGKK